MVWSLCTAMANLVWYLGLQATVSEIIIIFDILMQNFYKLQQGKSEKVTLYVT